MSDCAFFIDAENVVRHVSLDLAGPQEDGETPEAYQARREAFIPSGAKYFLDDYANLPADDAEALAWAQGKLPA